MSANLSTLNVLNLALGNRVVAPVHVVIITIVLMIATWLFTLWRVKRHKKTFAHLNEEFLKLTAAAEQEIERARVLAMRQALTDAHDLAAPAQSVDPVQRTIPLEDDWLFSSESDRKELARSRGNISNLLIKALEGGLSLA